MLSLRQILELKVVFCLRSRFVKSENQPLMPFLKRIPISLIPLLLTLSGCGPMTTTIEGSTAVEEATQFVIIPPHHTPGASELSPTPDASHPVPPLRTESLSYLVQAGDTLRLIGRQYNVSVEALVEANQLENPDLLSVGQSLVIPTPIPAAPAPAQKLIPDSELIYGPYAEYFDLQEFINAQNGHLAVYEEEVNGRKMSGTEILQLVSRNHSVNPRLLMAILDHQSGWLSRQSKNFEAFGEPFGQQISVSGSLYLALNWAANNLNRGYYLWRVNAMAGFTTTDGVVIAANPEINAGTAALQYFFSQLYTEKEWRQVVSPFGFMQTYQTLYGPPFEWSFEPLIPENLSQPTMQLPFEPGVPWTFTGGPHGAWGDGSAWAAIDFAPPMELLGCYPNGAWVTAVADGLVIRSDDGVVVQDLDGDGLMGTGWTLLYLHIGSDERVTAGTYLYSGDRIGHPSCEGGVSTGTHVHIARRYNGEWIPADGSLPFILDGWISGGTGILYEGTMQKGDQVVESCECQAPEHTLQR